VEIAARLNPAGALTPFASLRLQQNPKEQKRWRSFGQCIASWCNQKTTCEIQNPEIRGGPPHEEMIVTLEHRLKRRADLNFRAVDQEMVILDRASGLIHRLNSTASCLWDQCDGSSTTESIVERFARAFEIEPASAERDVIKVLSEMKELNLLEVVQ